MIRFGISYGDFIRQRCIILSHFIFLGYFLEIPKRLVRKQGNHCPICNDWLSNGERLEVDHIIPKEKGGDNTIDNKQLLHYYCHIQKTAQERSKDFKLAA